MPMPGQDGDRRQVRRRGFKTKKAAQEALDELRGKARTKSYVAPAKQSVKEYLSLWMARAPHGRASTGERRQLQEVPRRLRDPRARRPQTRRHDGARPRCPVRQVADSGRRREPYGGLSARTVRYYTHTVVSRALSDAVKKGQLARNVALAASPPSSKSTRSAEMRFWMPDEMLTFLGQVADEPLGPLFTLAALTGMRRGEVCGLRWSDVDLDGQPAHIDVRQQLTTTRGGPDGGFHFSEPKTDKGKRQVELDPILVAVLKARKGQQAEHRLAMGAGWTNERGLVFHPAGREPSRPGERGQVFERRVFKSRLPRIRFHDLRHCQVAYLIEARVPVLEVTRRLGHASVAFTLGQYGHLFPEAGSQAAAAVAAMVYGSQGADALAQK